MSGEEGGEGGKLPSVDHDPLNKGGCDKKIVGGFRQRCSGIGSDWSFHLRCCTDWSKNQKKVKSCITILVFISFEEGLGEMFQESSR
jgi:hypothetical protein